MLKTLINNVVYKFHPNPATFDTKKGESIKGSVK